MAKTSQVLRDRRRKELIKKHAEKRAALRKKLKDPNVSVDEKLQVQEAFAKLHLGIAQFKGGQKDAARTTWSGIKSDAGAESLAHAWTAISKV